MQILKGKLLHKKQFTSKKGDEIKVISVLDEYEKFSRVVDLMDFDDTCKSINPGTDIEISFIANPSRSDKTGVLFINYVIAGTPIQAKRLTS